MQNVLVFSSLGVFSSQIELEQFVNPAYTEDGDQEASRFMKEIDLIEHEPCCIESAFEEPAKLRELLAGTSYFEEWASQLPEDVEADSFICLYEPNKAKSPNNIKTMIYHGSFSFQP